MSASRLRLARASLALGEAMTEFQAAAVAYIADGVPSGEVVGLVEVCAQLYAVQRGILAYLRATTDLPPEAMP